VAGGANFPGGRPWDGHAKRWHDRIFVLSDPGGEWRELSTPLPRPVAYGVSISWRDRLIVVGGGDGSVHHDAVYEVHWDGEDVRFVDLPALPTPLAFGCGVRVGDTVVVMGGIDRPAASSCLDGVFAMDLAAEEREWRTVARLPGGGRMLACAGAIDSVINSFISIS